MRKKTWNFKRILILGKCDEANTDTLYLATGGKPRTIRRGAVKIEERKFFSKDDLLRLQNEISFCDNDMRKINKCLLMRPIRTVPTVEVW